MSITNTVLIFVVVPAVIVAVIVALSLAGAGGRRQRRYRPGRPYDFGPTWFVASQRRTASVSAASAQPPALASGEVKTGGRVPAGSTGGASDRW